MFSHVRSIHQLQHRPRITAHIVLKGAEGDEREGENRTVRNTLESDDQLGRSVRLLLFSQACQTAHCFLSAGCSHTNSLLGLCLIQNININ